jgi:hypothetical protein
MWKGLGRQTEETETVRPRRTFRDQIKVSLRKKAGQEYPN